MIRSLKGRNRVAVTQAFSNKYKLRVGDKIVLPLGNARPEFTVAGIYYDYASERGFVTNRPCGAAEVSAGCGTDEPGNLSEAGGRTVGRYCERFGTGRAAFGVESSPNEVLRTEAVKIFDRTFAVTWALEGVAIIVAMLGAANSLLAMVLDRRREFGLLQYLGGSAAQIRRTVAGGSGTGGNVVEFAGPGAGVRAFAGTDLCHQCAEFWVEHSVSSAGFPTRLGPFWWSGV